MAIAFKCPGCEKLFKVDDELGDKVAACLCGVKFRIPGAPGTYPAPDAYAEPDQEPVEEAGAAVDEMDEDFDAVETATAGDTGELDAIDEEESMPAAEREDEPTGALDLGDDEDTGVEELDDEELPEDEAEEVEEEAEEAAEQEPEYDEIMTPLGEGEEDTDSETGEVLVHPKKVDDTTDGVEAVAGEAVAAAPQSWPGKILLLLGVLALIAALFLPWLQARAWLAPGANGSELLEDGGGNGGAEGDGLADEMMDDFADENPPAPDGVTALPAKDDSVNGLNVVLQGAKKTPLPYLLFGGIGLSLILLLLALINMRLTMIGGLVLTLLAVGATAGGIVGVAQLNPAAPGDMAALVGQAGIGFWCTVGGAVLVLLGGLLCSFGVFVGAPAAKAETPARGRRGRREVKTPSRRRGRAKVEEESEEDGGEAEEDEEETEEKPARRTRRDRGRDKSERTPRSRRRR